MNQHSNPHPPPRTSTIPRPPTVEGTVSLRWFDGLRILGWGVIGYIHSAVRGNLVAGLMMIGWIFSIPVLLLMQPFVVSRRNARYYMTPERDAVLAVAATRHGWRIDEHASAVPGTARGKALRAGVVPPLVAAADRHHVAIYGTAATPKLARIYAEALPGLVDAGPGWPRGRKLCRPPVNT